jgi:hypothetical protein
MADWEVDASRPATMVHTAALAGGTARAVVSEIAGSEEFALRVFICKPGRPEEELPLEAEVFADSAEAADAGRRAAEAALG